MLKTDFATFVNTREEEHAYHIEVDLPGVSKDDINVDDKDNIVTISGERKTKEEVKEEDYYSVESSYGKFERSFTLPDDVDVENIPQSQRMVYLKWLFLNLQKLKNSLKK